MAISEEIESYLSNIEEYVFDEKKIVTYSWLAKTFGIHSNLSKQLLHTFVETNSRKAELSTTYLLIGLSDSGDTHQVLVVKDKDLEEVESHLKSITSKHVYSVQKCLELSDINALYIADKRYATDSISKGISAIHFNCNERDNALLAKLKTKALPVVSKQPAAPAKKVETQAKIKTKSPEKSMKGDQSSKKTEEDKGTDTKTENKAVVPSMFKNNIVSKKKPAEKVTVNSKKPQGIGAFFSKTTSKPSSDLKKVAESEKVKETKETDLKVKERLSPQKENKATLNIAKEENRTTSKVDDNQQAPVNSMNAETKAKSSSSKVSTKRGKKSTTKKVGKQKEQKKRKRLIVLSDSDSSEEEEEVIREPTPEPEPTIIPDTEMDDDIICGTPEPTKKRKKKLVSRSFTSSDGFLVTEKEYVDTSCSEGEEAVPEKKFKGDSSADGKPPEKQSDSKSETKTGKSPTNGKKESPKSLNTSPQKTKQASLMSFFKKK